MFKKLINQLLALAGQTQKSAAPLLGYKSQSAFHSAIQNKDLKVSVLASVCSLCGFDLIITNHEGITISLLKYIEGNADPDTEQQ